MKYYYSQPYKDKQGQTKQNVFFILEQNELETLAVLTRQLRDTMLTWPKTSVKLNSKDWQALEFLQRMCEPEHGGELIDPTDWQIAGIVDKLLIKTVGVDFVDWLMPCLTESDWDKDDITAHMNAKRKRLAQYKSRRPEQCQLFDW